MADMDINETITANKNLCIMQTQVNQTLNNIIVTEGLGKSVLTSEGTLHILSSIDLIIKSGESIAIVGGSGFRKININKFVGGIGYAQFRINQP